MPAANLKLDYLKKLPLDGSFKGLPAGITPLTLGTLQAQGWSLLKGDLSLPIALVKESVLRDNSRWMRDFTQLSGIRICPHGKTTMCPQLFDMQLADGAWGITAANLTHVKVYLDHGVRRILLANPLISTAEMDFVINALQQYEDLDFYCLVDNELNVGRLSQRVSERGMKRPLQVLLEIGMPGGRCGVRTLEQAQSLARKIGEAHPQLALRGIEAFEGIVDLFSEAGQQRIDAMLQVLIGTAEYCEVQGLFAEGELLLTAGGSACFDSVAGKLKAARLTRPFEVVIRSGCYLVHDDGFYGKLTADLGQRSKIASALKGGLKPALEVWAQVQSLPEPGLAIVAMGKRDVGTDVTVPQAKLHFRPGRDTVPVHVNSFETQGLNDQHLYLKIPIHADLQLGDLLGFGISHPCTTFDKWSVVFCVDDNYVVTSGLKTFF